MSVPTPADTGHGTVGPLGDAHEHPPETPVVNEELPIAAHTDWHVASVGPGAGTE